VVRRDRPVNLDLMSLKFPSTAIVSILHRISGVALFLLTPVMLYWLYLSLASELSFSELGAQLESPLWRLMLWIFTTALTYHAFAGVRHLLMDMGWGEDLSSARKSAVWVIVFAVLGAGCLGVLIW
jgi:succinate dehydrogenase / fumarate reductase, cytochrome b subunit